MFKLNQSRRRVGRVGQLVPRTALLRMQREPAGDDRACNRKFTSYRGLLVSARAPGGQLTIDFRQYPKVSFFWIL